MAGFEVTLYGRIWVTPEDIMVKAYPVLIKTLEGEAFTEHAPI